MKTLLLITIATLITLIWCLPTYAIHPTRPVVTDRQATPSSTTAPLRLIKPLAIKPNDKFRDYLLHLIINRHSHTPRWPGWAL